MEKRAEKKEKPKMKVFGKKGGAWKGRGTLVIKRPHTEVPQWIPRGEAVNSIATDHKGTTEPGDSAQTVGHTSISMENTTSPVQFDRK